MLEGKRGYRSFLRFLGECDGVINLTAGNILGRITFLTAALGRPGIFSDNSQLNAQLYPGSTVAMFDTCLLYTSLVRTQRTKIVEQPYGENQQRGSE